MYELGEIVNLVSDFNILGFFTISGHLNNKYVLEEFPSLYFREEDLVPASMEEYDQYLNDFEIHKEMAVMLCTKFLTKHYPKFEISFAQELLSHFGYNFSAFSYTTALLESLDTTPFYIDIFSFNT